jgi:hypothetical protein
LKATKPSATSGDSRIPFFCVAAQVFRSSHVDKRTGGRGGSPASDSHGSSSASAKANPVKTPIAALASFLQIPVAAMPFEPPRRREEVFTNRHFNHMKASIAQLKSGAGCATKLACPPLQRLVSRKRTPMATEAFNLRGMVSRSALRPSSRIKQDLP